MKKPVFVSLTVILVAALLFSGYQIYRYFFAEQQAEQEFSGLAERIDPQPSEPGQSYEATTQLWTVHDRYGDLFAQNEDMIGWLKIDGTTLDYPVMQTPHSPDFYLKRDFEGKYSDYGVPYAAEGCLINPQSDNITIYGHHMSSGKMFGTLEDYKNEAFWREHKTIRFDTRTDFGTYEIIAVFKVDPVDFPYHAFIKAADAAEFDEYVSRCKELAFYDTGISAEYGDKLISLSTCEYSQNNNRLVVVARKIGGRANG